MRIAWRLQHDDPGIASLRYRCLLPAHHLERLGVRSRLSWGPHDPLAGEPPAALIFVKTFRADDLELALRAVDRAIPVLLDLCDNPFAPGYRESPGGIAHTMLEPMAELASGIVTTGPALAEALRARLPASAPVHIVPDGAETPADVTAGRRRLLAARARIGPKTLASAAERSGRRALTSAVARRRVPHRRDDSSLPRVIWFGNIGSSLPRFGLINLLDIADELAAAARERPFRLLVVSGSETAFQRHVAQLPLPTEYRPWVARRIRRDLRDSDVAIVPNSRDAFSICKSANRVVLALSAGVPVVATSVPALEPFDGSVALDDFPAGIIRYLDHPEKAARDVRLGQAIIEREYSGAAIAERWKVVLAGVSAGRM